MLAPAIDEGHTLGVCQSDWTVPKESFGKVFIEMGWGWSTNIMPAQGTHNVSHFQLAVGEQGAIFQDVHEGRELVPHSKGGAQSKVISVIVWMLCRCRHWCGG